jgi:hypothetical protein
VADEQRSAALAPVSQPTDGVRAIEAEPPPGLHPVAQSTAQPQLSAWGHPPTQQPPAEATPPNRVTAA